MSLWYASTALRRTLIAGAASLSLFAGTSYADDRGGDYVVPTGDAPATANPTPYSGALYCLSTLAQNYRLAAPRIGVGRISDMTGKFDYDTGAKVTQGASLFAMTALGKAGLPVVERVDESVADIELNYAKQHLLSDTPERAGTDPDNYRPIYAGQIAGSRYYVVGGITELNPNLASSGVQASLTTGSTTGTTGGAQVTASSYVLNIAIDLRLVDSRSQAVVKTVSYQKQVRGYELDGGLTGSAKRVGGALTGGKSAIEPIQAAVRTLIERGVFDLAEYIYVGGDRQTSCL